MNNIISGSIILDEDVIFPKKEERLLEEKYKYPVGTLIHLKEVNENFIVLGGTEMVRVYKVVHTGSMDWDVRHFNEQLKVYSQSDGRYTTMDPSIYKEEYIEIIKVNNETD